MNKKNQSRVLGKQIRKETGLSLPIAMGIAKLWVRANLGKTDRFSSNYEVETYSCGYDCCGPTDNIIVHGPKGIIVLSPIGTGNDVSSTVVWAKKYDKSISYGA